MRLHHVLIIAASIVLAAPQALAVEQGNLTVSTVTTSLTGVALNAAAATRTITANLTQHGTIVSGSRPLYSKMTVTVAYTYSAATTVTAQFSCSMDGTTYGRRTSTSTSAGASTIYAETGTYTTGAASIDLNLEYDVRGCKSVKVVLGGAGAGAGDLVTATWVAVAGS